MEILFPSVLRGSAELLKGNRARRNGACDQSLKPPFLSWGLEEELPPQPGARGDSGEATARVQGEHLPSSTQAVRDFR